MARIVNAVAGGEGARAVSFRTIEELLQTCASSSVSDPIPEAAMTTNRRMGPFVSDAIVKGSASEVCSGEGEGYGAGLSDESTLFDRLQAPCSVGSCVPPVVSATTKAEMADTVRQVQPASARAAAVCMTSTDSDGRGSVAPGCDVNGDDNAVKHPTLGRFMSQQDGPALLDDQLLETFRRESAEARDHCPSVRKEEASQLPSDVDVMSKFGPTLLDPGTVLARGATTTTCSIVSGSDDARHGDAGRAHQSVLDQVASSAFPFTSTNASSTGAVNGSQQGDEGDGSNGLKRSDEASAAFKVDGQLSVPQESSDMQADSSSCGVWSFCASAPSNSPSMEQLLQRVCHTTKTQQEASPAGETRLWDAEGRRLWEQAQLSANTARLGGNADGCGTVGQSDVYNHLAALCNSSMSGVLPAWEMLQPGSPPLPLGTPTSDPRLNPCSVLLPGDPGCHVAAPGGETLLFGQRGATTEALPHLSGVLERLSPSQLALLLQADAMRSQEVFNHCGGVGGLGATDIEDLLGRVRQLQGVAGMNDLAFPEAPQGNFFGNLSQPQSFPFFCFPHTGASNAAGLLLPRPDAPLGNVHDLARAQAVVKTVRKAEAVAKKVRKEAGFTDSAQKKKPKNPKSKDTSRAESPCPGSPKLAPRRKRGGSQSSNGKGSEGSDGSEVVANSLANDLRAMTELANMTDEDVAELEAEAYRRMSNRSKNAPPEVITALDFDGSLIRFSKVIGLHYHPKQNRWLAWRSQKGSKKVFKSFSTKKFGIAGARLMALRWRLGYGVAPEEGQDGLSDSNDILDEEQAQQSLSGDERYQLPLDATGLCDELSDTTATGGQGRSESSTPSNGHEMIPATPPAEEKAKTTTTSEQVKGKGAGIKWEAAGEKVPSSPVVAPAASTEESKLTVPLSSLISDRLGLLLGSITPADDDLTESDRSKLATLSLQGGGEFLPSSLAHKELCAG